MHLNGIDVLLEVNAAKQPTTTFERECAGGIVSNASKRELAERYQAAVRLIRGARPVNAADGRYW